MTFAAIRKLRQRLGVKKNTSTLKENTVLPIKETEKFLL
jgi:hypothetical protein